MEPSKKDSDKDLAGKLDPKKKIVEKKILVF